jgi:hypothetical protein
MNLIMRTALRRLTMVLIAALLTAGCTRAQMMDTTISGVRVQITGSAIGKAKVEVEGETLTVNGHNYGAVSTGDTVVVSETGVTVNGTPRSKQAGI